MQSGIEDVRNLGEPLRSYQFRLTFADPVGMSAINLRMRCTSLTLPGSSIEETVASVKGHEIRFAGLRKFSGSWNTSFIEYADNAMLRGLDEWMKACNDPVAGITGNSDDYKRNALVEMLDNAGNPVSTRRIHGIWPSDYPDLNLDDNSSEQIKFDVPWKYDYWEFV